MKRMLVSALLALVVAAAVAERVQAKGVEACLEMYFMVRKDLAADKFADTTKTAAAMLADVADDAALRDGAKAFATAADIDAGRKAFGTLSKAMLEAVERAVKEGKKPLFAVYVFECPMAKPYGKWLQAEEDIGNPYFGSKMLKCGEKVAVLGGQKK